MDHHDMDHGYIAEHSLIERYLQGRLPAAEEARFEEHFLDCAQCQAQLELARGFARGFKAMAAEDAAGAVRLGLLGWLLHHRWRAGAALAALFVAALLPSLWLVREQRALRDAVSSAELTAAEWQERLAGAEQSSAELAARLAASEAERRAERGELEARLAELAADAGRAVAEQVARPLANTPVFLLRALRGDAGAPPQTIDLGRAGEYLALAVDAGDDPRFARYRVTVTDARGAVRFSRSDLERNSLETLLITFPASFFSPGDYRLAVTGFLADGGAVDLGEYPFRVVA